MEAHGFDAWLLTLVVFTPAVGALIVMLIPRKEEVAVKAVTLLTTVLTFAWTVVVLARFDYGQSEVLQFSVDKEWIPVINSQYHVGLDGIALPLLALSAFMTVLCVIYSWNHFPEPHNPKAFLTLLLVLEVGMNGTFVAQDLILFFIFFEIVLLPMFFMIGVWGGPNKEYASIKFFLFTLFGSALMLLSFLALYFQVDVDDKLPGIQHSFDIVRLSAATADGLGHSAQLLIFAGLFLGFAIKVPMFPFHTWLPDAHTEAPTVGSVLLAAVLLKLGTYGFVRIALPIMPDEAVDWAPWIGLLAIIGIIYGALGCLAQRDMKRLIAFSSVADMGFVMLGIASLTTIGINAAIFGMVAHGLITGMLFFVAGSVQHNYGTREMSCLGGLLKQAPKMGWILAFCAMASLGLPGLAGFWGEFPAVLSAFEPGGGLSEALFRSYMVIAAVGTVLAAGHPLWMLQKVAFGVPKPEFENAHVHDVSSFEWLAWTPILLLIVVLGIYPNALFKVTDPPVACKTVQNISQPTEGGCVEAVVESGEPVAAGHGAELLLAVTRLPTPVFDWHAFAPELVIIATMIIVLIADLFLPDRESGRTSSIAALGLLAALIPIATLGYQGVDPARELFGGAYVVDNYALALKAFFILAAYLVILLSVDYINEGDYYKGEFYFLLLVSTLGMTVMASARDLITLFVALETISIPTFVLATFRKHDRKSNEAGVKYYLIGVLSSALMLYGMSLIFGLSNSTTLSGIREYVSQAGTDPLLAVAIFLSIVGFAFKISAVPFHFWAPDTYEGAPTPVTAFLSVSSKAGGFITLINIIYFGFFLPNGEASDMWWPVLWVLAAASMTLGNLTALKQTNIVRMLAYSSIAEGGFMLVPFVAAGIAGANGEPGVAAQSMAAVVVYLLIYGAMNLGAFAVVIAVARRTRSGEISSYAGLFQTSPGLAVVMTFFMASLAGIPPLAGWFAKFVMFRSIIEAGTGWGIALAVIAAVNSVIAFVYYFRVVVQMWIREPATDDRTPITMPQPLAISIGLTAAVVLVVGVYPQIFARVGELAF